MARIEKELAEAYHRPELVLADYFDLIAGTSSGSIIAAALALGRTVAEIQEAFESLGREVFSKNILDARWKNLRGARKGARYPAGPLEKQLRGFFEDGTAPLTLGDPRFRTLFLITMHNTTTDSPWVLTNSTSTKYNSNSRLLLPVPDRNLDIPLLDLLRASSAAPTYFPPKTIQLGQRRFDFQDGGITPFNNPSLIAFTVATTKEFDLNWRVGARNLLIVSIGTGSNAAAQPVSHQDFYGAMGNLRLLPNQFMSGASFGQDLLARVLGRCVTGMPLDREIGSLTESRTHGLFTYARYDARLDDHELLKLNISRRDAKRLRRLDRADQIANLRTIGREASGAFDIQSHIREFL